MTFERAIVDRRRRNIDDNSGIVVIKVYLQGKRKDKEVKGNIVRYLRVHNSMVSTIERAIEKALF